MNAKQLHEEIKATNLSYMSLVQKMIRANKAVAASSLGVSDEMAELVAGLSSAQLLKMSATNLMLCSFHFDESAMLNMIGGSSTGKSNSKARTAKQPAEAIAA
ncbi:MAG: flagellar transcriptional regulator FlhD [Gallionellaceae bacterium]